MHPLSLMAPHTHPSVPFRHTARREAPAQFLRSFHGTQSPQIIDNQCTLLPLLPTQKLLRTYCVRNLCYSNFRIALPIQSLLSMATSNVRFLMYTYANRHGFCGTISMTIHPAPLSAPISHFTYFPANKLRTFWEVSGNPQATFTT